MAKVNSDGSIVLSTAIDTTGVKTGITSMKKLSGAIIKTFAGVSVAAGVAAGAITKMAVSAYADYEQLVGGVETMFKQSADKVKNYADDAFYNVGMSANEYMQQVTSFSASLIRSTANDTDKAADVANMALIDMADNANKMGSSLESITTAYQGFAKQQYQLLDNLKLGYGGTKSEMERLLKDAQKISGVKYNIDNLADVYNAIHTIQVQLGIAGTTAKEAEKTISGSANMMKSAWKNVLTAISKGGDIDKAINNLVYSVKAYFQNLVPVIERAMSGIGRLIAQVAPMLIQNVAKALIQSIPSLVNAAYQMLVGLAKGIWQGFQALFFGESSKVTAEVSSGVKDVGNSAEDAASSMTDLGDATEEAGEKAKKSLATFDTLQILSSQNNKSSVDDLFNADAVSNFEAEMNSENSSSSGLQNLLEPLQEVFETIKGIAEIVTEGFWDTFKAPDFTDLKSDIASIGTSVSAIFSNEDVQTSFGNFGESLLTALGQVVGSMATIGAAIASNVIGGFEVFLAEQKDVIAANLAHAFDVSSSIVSTLGDLAGAIGTIFSSIGSQAGQNFTGALLSAMYTITAGLSSLCLDIGNSIVDFIATPIIDNQGKIKNALENAFSSATPILNSFSELAKRMFDGVGEFWQKAIDPALQTISQAISSVFGSILDLWNTSVGPSLSSAFSAIGQAIESTLGPSISKLFASLSELGGAIASLLEPIASSIQNIASMLGQAFSAILPLITGVFQSIAEVCIGIVSGIIDSISSRFNALAGIIKSIMNGDILGAIRSAVEGIKGIFGGLASAISSIFEGAFSLIRNFIDNIESAVSGIVNVGKSILGVFGGSSSSTSSASAVSAMPTSYATASIPHLATGAVIPPNREFLAILGDQKSGVNVEAPISTIEEAVGNVISKQSRAMTGANGGTTVVLEVDGYEFGRVAMEQIQRQKNRIKTSVVVV